MATSHFPDPSLPWAAALTLAIFLYFVIWPVVAYLYDSKGEYLTSQGLVSAFDNE